MRNEIFCTGKASDLELKYECNSCKKTGTAVQALDGDTIFLYLMIAKFLILK